MVKILIVEDQTLLLDTLKDVIGLQPDMKVVGTADDASLAPELCRKLKPALVLMDVMSKNDSNGIDFAAQIRKEMPEIKIVIMTGLPEITFADKAKKAGVHSFMNKDSGKEYLLFVIHNTMKGNGIYPGESDSKPFTEKFTERELSVLRLICQGKSRNEVVDELAMSESLVKKIIATILDKTCFNSISKFAVYAVGKGLITP
ncbi:MAG: response regulator transcription factor [Treponema sp.]|jgi:DNA-binding NarL/FixJ family response regulator|nr:response regulator transcription factor [Treponema sp.]